MKKILLAMIVLFAVPGRAEAIPSELVTNGDFETGNFTGWTFGGNSIFVRSDHPHSGTFEAKLGTALSAGFLSQTLATVAGTTYDLSFWLQADRVLGNPQNFFDVSLNGAQIFHEVVSGRTGGHDYQEHSFSFLATGLTTLRFDFRNDQRFFRLDDVSVQVSAIPEPSTLVLFGVGLAGLALRRRTKS